MAKNSAHAHRIWRGIGSRCFQTAVPTCMRRFLFVMTSRLFIARVPACSDLEAFVADLVIQGDTRGPPIQILKARCRELARAESALLVSPTPQSLHHTFGVPGKLSLWIVAKKGVVGETKVAAKLCQLGIKVGEKARVDHVVLQTCYKFTVIARLAPKWNQVTHWLIKGSDFLTSGKGQAINLEVGVTDIEVTLNLVVSKLSFNPLKPEDLNATSTVLQAFRSNPDYVIPETSIYANRCILLPNFSSGFVYSASHRFSSSPGFPNYDKIRLHWKKQHGIVLPEKQDLFYQVFFKINSKTFFSYPGCCVFKTLPTSFPSREADSVTAAFIADIHTRVPTICGTAVKYSSKALTPLAILQPAVGCTREHTNLKPVELIPELDLNRFPIPPLLRISHPVTAALPNESASFGVHSHPIHVQNRYQTILTQGAPQWQANIMPTTAKHSVVTGFSACATPPDTPSMFMSQSVHPLLNVPPQFAGASGRGVVGQATGSSVPRIQHSGGQVLTPALSVTQKVIPQFGPTQRVAVQQSQAASALNTSKQTASISKGRASLSNVTNSSQPPAKKLRFDIPSQPPPQSQPTVSAISQQGPGRCVVTSTPLPALASAVQDRVQQSRLHSSTHPQVVQEMMHASVKSTASRQAESVSRADHQENRPAQVRAVDVAQNPSAEKARPQVQRKEPVEVNGVSNDIIMKISKCKIPVLKKWLQENGVKYRSKDKKDDLTKLVTTYLRQTGKTFEL